MKSTRLVDIDTSLTKELSNEEYISFIYHCYVLVNSGVELDTSYKKLLEIALTKLQYNSIHSTNRSFV